MLLHSWKKFNFNEYFMLLTQNSTEPLQMLYMRVLLLSGGIESE